MICALNQGHKWNISRISWSHCFVKVVFISFENTPLATIPCHFRNFSKMGRTNRKRKAKTLDTFQGQYFYPIYKGWVLDKTFIFNNPTAALCFQLSRYKKDLLLYSYSSHPKWLHCIAHLHPSHEDDVELTTFESQS